MSKKPIGTTKKRSSMTGLYVALILVVTGMGYVYAAAWNVSDGDILNINTALITVLKNPSLLKWNEYSKYGIVFGLIIAVVFCIYILCQPNKYAFGYEQGEEEWANPAEVTKRLASHDDAENRVYTRNLKISFNPDISGLNANVLCVGGSGKWKTTGEVIPNLLHMGPSFVVTDPKGSVYKKTAAYLHKNGYKIQVLNLKTFKETDYYNPFCFIKDAEEIPKLLTVLFANTTKKGAVDNNPFWEKAEFTLLEALFRYEYTEDEYPTIPKVNELLNLAVVKTDKQNNVLPSPLDELINKLDDNNPAKIKYKKIMVGAADTIRSVIITAQARMNLFENEKVKKLMSRNTINFRELGFGGGDNPDKKSILYLIIPDADQTYNAIAAMCYTQLIQTLYDLADEQPDNHLPVPVSLIMDEFINISLPEEYPSYLSTMRERWLSAFMIIQNMAQLKEKYKEQWENIVGNCDIFLYLGGNEGSTHKYISEELGNMTLDKRTHGKTEGRNESSSRNFDFYGRELLKQAEVRRLPVNQAIVLVSGEFPIIDLKIKGWKEKVYKEATRVPRYVHKPIIDEQEVKTSKEKQEEELNQMGVTFEEALSGKPNAFDETTAQILEEYAKLTNRNVDMVMIDNRSPIEKLRIYFGNYSDEAFDFILEALREGFTPEQIDNLNMPDEKMYRLLGALRTIYKKKEEESDNGQKV